MNIYHDGEEGLGQHFDDAIRFRQVIFLFKKISLADLQSEGFFGFAVELWESAVYILQWGLYDSAGQRLYLCDGR
jgi:hypothetical protein